MLDFLDENSHVYIFCPARVASGGPELLHQLAAVLKERGKKVSIFYYPASDPDPMHPNYAEYNLGFVREIPDEPQSVVLVPEVSPEKVFDFKKAHKIIWWLSIDNYFINLPGLKKRINRFWLKKLSSQKFKFFDRRLVDVDAHLAQSAYASQVLKKQGVKNIHYLGDFLHASFLEENTDLSLKENFVAYNPKKGLKFTKKLMRHAPDIQFVPIENMTRKQVVDLLKKAKVYIDFGNHPGMDRIPREAAHLRACVITNKMGSAANAFDVPIPEEFKYEGNATDIDLICKKIRDCFQNFSENDNKLLDYRKFIMAQQMRFSADVENIFC